MSQWTRREFFQQGAVYGGSLWVLVNLPRPRALQAALESDQREVLSEAEWRVVESMTARIIPTDHEPGAVEANCVNFIDKTLAHEDAALAPFYRDGIAAIESVSRRRFEKGFADLTAEQQDEILVALESGAAPGWPSGGGDVSSMQFFEAVRVHTLIGFVADPKYGGNRDFAGWKVVGYPGGGHHLGGYSPAQMAGKDKIKTAWGEEV